MPTVSVVIPTYNRAHLISRAIRSVNQQTYQDIEIIIVDDGSTDNTKELVKQLKDSRMLYIRSSQNRGGAAARNIGIQASRGKYIAFLDSDDEWFPEKIYKQVQALVEGEEEVGMVYTGILFMGENGIVSNENKPVFRGKILPQLLRTNVIGSTSSAMIKRFCLEAVGMFDEQFPSRQDLDLWIRIAAKYNIEYVPEALTIHHIHKNRISSDHAAKIKGHELLLDKYDKYFQMYRKELAWQIYTCGQYHLLQGDIKQTKKLWWDSIKKWPYPKVLIKLFLLFMGRKYYFLGENISNIFKRNLKVL